MALSLLWTFSHGWAALLPGLGARNSIRKWVREIEQWSKLASFFPPFLFLLAFTAILVGAGVSSPHFWWLISPVFLLKYQNSPNVTWGKITWQSGFWWFCGCVVLTVLTHLLPAVLLGGEPASWGRQRGASGGLGCRGSQNPEVVFDRELPGAAGPGHRRQSSGDREGNQSLRRLLQV